MRGSTQRASGSRGFLTSGGSGRRIGSMAASSSLRIRALMPLPTCPAWRRPPSSLTATISEPRSLCVPCPGSQPTTTISCSRRSLIFSQSRLRRLGW